MSGDTEIISTAGSVHTSVAFSAARDCVKDVRRENRGYAKRDDIHQAGGGVAVVGVEAEGGVVGPEESREDSRGARTGRAGGGRGPARRWATA